MTILMITHNTKDEALISIETINMFKDADNLNLIVVDNASTDKTGEALENIPQITYVYMDEGKCSFSKIFNDVTKTLNIKDDLLVMGQPLSICPHTLSNMRKTLENPDVAIVCGMGNSFVGYQQLPAQIHTYNDIMALSSKPEQESSTAYSLSAFSECFLIKGELLEKLGRMDETYHGLVFAIQDYCIRAITMGKKIAINKNAYFWQPSGRIIFEHTSDPEYDLDTEHRENVWGIHYFTVLGNPNLLTLIDKKPQDSFDILEVGCDCGGSLLVTKNFYPNANIFGTDINPHSINIAKHVCNAATNNIEDKNLPFENQLFDYIVFGDVLEHLRDPLGALKYCREFLKDDGCIITSIPNLMHISVMEELMHGFFTYKDAGLLDRTHIHMFTYKEIIRMFLEAELNIEDVRFSVVEISDAQKELTDSLMKISKDVERYMFETFQYVIRARKKNKA